MWSYSNFIEITKKYYRFTDLESTNQFELGKTFMKGAIGTHGFFNYIITSDYVKMSDSEDFTENVLTIRRSSLKEDTFENGVYVNAQRAIILAVKAYDKIELKIDASSQTAKLYYGEPDFTDACKAIYKGRDPEYGNTELTLKLIELWYDYILPKYIEDYYWIIETDNNFNKKYSSLLYKIKSFVNDTSKYYSKIIDLYISKENNLLDKLTSTNSQTSSTTTAGNSITLENAVPGTENESEYIFDETHTNSASKNTNDGTSENTSEATFEREVEPIIDQLNRIREKFDDIYTEWSNRFGEVLCGLDFD